MDRNREYQNKRLGCTVESAPQDDGMADRRQDHCRFPFWQNLAERAMLLYISPKTTNQD